MIGDVLVKTEVEVKTEPDQDATQYAARLQYEDQLRRQVSILVWSNATREYIGVESDPDAYADYTSIHMYYTSTWNEWHAESHLKPANTFIIGDNFLVYERATPYKNSYQLYFRIAEIFELSSTLRLSSRATTHFAQYVVSCLRSNCIIHFYFHTGKEDKPDKYTTLPFIVGDFSSEERYNAVRADELKHGGATVVLVNRRVLGYIKTADAGTGYIMYLRLPEDMCELLPISTVCVDEHKFVL